MSNEQVARSSFHAVWSAFHFPKEPNHVGHKVWELFKNNALGTSQTQTFANFDSQRSFSMAADVITEMQNLVTSNGYVKSQIVSTLETGANDSKIEMPPIDLPTAVATTTQNYNNDSDSDGPSIWTILAIILFIIKLLLAFAR